MKVRTSLYLGSGEAGIGILASIAKWLDQGVPKRKLQVGDTTDDGPIWPSKGGKGKTKAQALFMGADTDRISEERFKAVKSVLERLGLPARYIPIMGPTAGQNPVTVHSRLDVNEMLGALKGAIAETNFDISSLQAAVLINSMHGTGAAVNTFMAEKVLPELTNSSAYKAMVAVAADLSRITSVLQYARSLNWTLSMTERLLQQRLLDAVIVVDNTLLSAVASVTKGLITLERLVAAWKPVRDYVIKEGESGYDEYAEAYKATYEQIIKLGRLDPRDTNDVVTEVISPLTTIPSFGGLLDRRLEASSSQQDFMNLANLVHMTDNKGNVRGTYVLASYLPSNLARSALEQYDFRKLARILSFMWTGPVDLAEVVSLIVVIGDELRDRWQARGVYFARELERAFEDLGWEGYLDVMYVTGSSSIWLFAVQDKIVGIKGIFTEEEKNAEEEKGEEE